MNRIYHHYEKWEDYEAGLFKVYHEDEELLIKKSGRLLKDSKKFYEVMLNVLSEWRCASEVNMTNTSRNRQAWLGQASCCFVFGSPEYVTKWAWRMLSKEEQDEANKTADRIINLWDKANKKGNRKISDWSAYSEIKNREKQERLIDA